MNGYNLLGEKIKIEIPKKRKNDDSIFIKPAKKQKIKHKVYVEDEKNVVKQINKLFEPQFNKISMIYITNSNDLIQRSKTLDNIFKNYNYKYSKVLIELGNNKNVKLNNLAKKQIIDNIYNFLKLNENNLYKMNPILNNKLESQEDLVERYKIENHRIKALKNQFGIRAKKDLKKGVILGKYLGNEYLLEEYNIVFESSRKSIQRNMYSFDVTIDNNNIMVIDGLSVKNLLMYVNDCRQNIKLKHILKEDKKHWNVSFITVKINEYPHIFLITNKNIKQGVDLLSFYGFEYGVTIDQCDRQIDFFKQFDKICACN